LKGANLNENWRNTWYGESSGCYVLKRSQEFFQEYEAEQKTKQKNVVFGSANTILLAKQGYAVDGTTEGVTENVVEDKSSDNWPKYYI